MNPQNNQNTPNFNNNNNRQQFQMNHQNTQNFNNIIPIQPQLQRQPQHFQNVQNPMNNVQRSYEIQYLKCILKSFEEAEHERLTSIIHAIGEEEILRLSYYELLCFKDSGPISGGGLCDVIFTTMVRMDNNKGDVEKWKNWRIYFGRNESWYKGGYRCIGPMLGYEVWNHMNLYKYHFQCRIPRSDIVGEVGVEIRRLDGVNNDVIGKGLYWYTEEPNIKRGKRKLGKDKLKRYQQKKKIFSDKKGNGEMDDDENDVENDQMEMEIENYQLGLEQIVEMVGKYKKKYDNYNRSLAHYSCRIGLYDIVKECNEQGYNFNKQDIFGNTPIFYAKENGKNEIVEYLENVVKVKINIRNNDDLDYKCYAMNQNDNKKAPPPPIKDEDIEKSTTKATTRQETTELEQKKEGVLGLIWNFLQPFWSFMTPSKVKYLKWEGCNHKFPEKEVFEYCKDQIDNNAFVTNDISGNISIKCPEENCKCSPSDIAFFQFINEYDDGCYCLLKHKIKDITMRKKFQMNMTTSSERKKIKGVAGTSNYDSNSYILKNPCLDPCGNRSLSCGIGVECVGKKEYHVLKWEGCGHVFCEQDLVKHCITQIEENKIIFNSITGSVAVKCPVYLCTSVPISYKFFSFLKKVKCTIGDFKNYYDLLKEKGTRISLERSDGIYCSQCHEMITNEENKDEKVGVCPHCKTLLCLKCNSLRHDGKSCDENQREIQKETGIVEKKCPYCKTGIEKDDGCKKIRCKNCNGKFCWKCLMKLNNEEKDKKHICLKC